MEAFRRLLPGPQAEGLTAVELASEVPGPAPAARPFVLLTLHESGGYLFARYGLT